MEKVGFEFHSKDLSAIKPTKKCPVNKKFKTLVGSTLKETKMKLSLNKNHERQAQ
jgi:hypothetical protein